MNLLDQIDSRLNDPNFSLNRDEFEKASASMLSDIYPNLVPISGGSDDGRDAEISDPGGTIGVLITSARDLAGVLANLRSGCRQMVKKKVPIKRLILANIAELNASKRAKIVDAAKAEGFKVVQIYPRAWYADALRRKPDWRIKLLQLPGTPYTLTRPPIDDLSIDIDATVGRTEELAKIRDAGGDVIITGVPGVGKTHLVAQLDNAVFVEMTIDLGPLADHLLETDPVVVVLDDAGARPELLTQLQTIRRAHALAYRIIAVCWTHEHVAINDRLLRATTVEIDRMTKTELGQILRAQGITRDAVLHRIIGQAHGRPAWAVRLGEILKDGTAWQDVMRGHSVRSEVSRYLRNARISDHAYQILATVAFIGGVADTELRTVADLLGTTVLDLHGIVRKVAQSGLIDAEQGVSDEADRTVTYTVQPELLAASITADAYFSAEAPPVPLAAIRQALPSHDFNVVNNSVIAELVGAPHPSRPTKAQVVTAVDNTWNLPQEHLLRYYAMLGRTEATFVLTLVTDALRTALGTGSEVEEANEFLYYEDNTANMRGELLAELAAKTRDQVGVAEALAHLANGAVIRLEAGESIDSYLNSFFTTARESDLGEPTAVAELVVLSAAVSAMSAGRGHQHRVFIEIAARAMAPTWESNYMAPDKPRSFNLKSYLLPPEACRTATAPVLGRLEKETANLTPDEFEALAKALHTWVALSRGFRLGSGLAPTDEHKTAAEPVARRLAEILAATSLTPSTRLRLNDVAAPLRLHWPEQDSLFAALTGSNDDSIDDADDDDLPESGVNRYLARLEATAEAERAAVAAAIAPYVTQDPQVLCARLSELELDLATAKGGNKTGLVFERIADTDTDPVPWLEAAIDYGIAGHAYAVIQNLLSADTLPGDLLAKLLSSEDSRTVVVRTSLQHGTGRALASTIAAVTVKDFKHRMADHFIRVTPEALAHLDAHPNRQVAALAITCWAHWYDYRGRIDKEDIQRTEAQLAAIPNWTDTMLNLEVPNDLDEYALERGLVALARTSPTNFIKLFVRHVKKERNPFNDFDEWAPAAQSLSHSFRTEVWNQVSHHPRTRQIFWVLAGADTDWIAERLVDGTITKPGELLVAPTLRAPQRPPIERLVALFANRAEPERILASLPEPLSGDTVELAEHRLEQARELAESDIPDVAAIGQFGVEIYTQRVAAARKEARAHELRGDIWY